MRNVNPGIHDESAFGLFDRWLAEQEQQANDVAERAPSSTTGSTAHLKAVPEPVEEIDLHDQVPADRSGSADDTGTGTVAEPLVADPSVATPTARADSAPPDATMTPAPRLPDAEARIEALLKSLGERRADAPREARQGPPVPRTTTAAVPPAGPQAPAPTRTPEVKVQPEVKVRPEANVQPEVQPDEPESAEVEIEQDDDPAPAAASIAAPVPSPAPVSVPVAQPGEPETAGRSTTSTTKMLLTRGAAAIARRREARAEQAAERRLQEPPAPAPQFPMVVEFAPRKGTQRVLGLVLLVTATATAFAGLEAYQERTTVTIGIAGTLAGLTLIIWATRASAVVAKLTVRMGQLEVVANGALHRFDLTSHYTVVDVVGRPGSGGWKVIFHRRGMAPFVVDASMVDPHAFMPVFEFYRPDPVDQF